MRTSDQPISGASRDEAQRQLKEEQQPQVGPAQPQDGQERIFAGPCRSEQESARTHQAAEPAEPPRAECQQGVQPHIDVRQPEEEHPGGPEEQSRADAVNARRTGTQIRDTKDQLGAADDQAEHGGIPAGEEIQRREAVEQERGSGEKQANVGHQKSPAEPRTGIAIFVSWKLNVTIRRLVES